VTEPDEEDIEDDTVENVLRAANAGRVFQGSNYRTLAPDPAEIFGSSGSHYGITQTGNTSGWSGNMPGVYVSSNTAQATTFSAAELLSQ
jgi:hypothetical protein